MGSPTPLNIYNMGPYSFKHSWFYQDLKIDTKFFQEIWKLSHLNIMFELKYHNESIS